jgi:hypothetical protein
MKFTRHYTRPSTDVPFHLEFRPKEVQDFYQTEYIDHGHLTEEVTYSEDGLIMTIVQNWVDNPELIIGWMNHPTTLAWFEQRDNYNAEKGIIKSNSTYEYTIKGKKMQGVAP